MDQPVYVVEPYMQKLADRMSKLGESMDALMSLEDSRRRIKIRGKASIRTLPPQSRDVLALESDAYHERMRKCLNSMNTSVYEVRQLFRVRFDPASPASVLRARSKREMADVFTELGDRICENTEILDLLEDDGLIHLRYEINKYEIPA